MTSFPPSYQKDGPVMDQRQQNHGDEKRSISSGRWISLAVVTMAACFAAAVFLRRAHILPSTSFSQSSSLEKVEIRGGEEGTRARKILEALLHLQTEIDGTVYLSDDSGFTQAARVFISSAVANDRAPWAVIEVATEADVQTTVPVLSRLKQDYGFPFRIRSGGHNKAGYSTVAQGAVLSLARLNDIDLVGREQEGAIARMGPAVHVRQFLEQVLKPHGYGGVVGYCGTVAEGGFILGGGLGIQSRMHGLGLDNVLSMRIVLADGTVRQVSSDSSNALDQDLFWALRGAGGGSFGVVTQMDYRVHRAANRLVFTYLTLPDASDRATFLHRLGEREKELPGNLVVMHDIEEAVGVGWSGRNDQEFESSAQYVESLFQELLPPGATVTDTNTTDIQWTAMFDAFDNDWSPDAYAMGCWYGFLLPENNTAEIWRDIMERISNAVHDSPGGFLLPDIELWGGAIHNVPWNATAFPYRSAIFNVGVLLTIPEDQPNAAQVFEEESAKVDEWWPEVAQHLTGSYVNYPTTWLLQQDYAQVYWGDNLPRLVETKRKVDPQNVFEFSMSVPMAV